MRSPIKPTDDHDRIYRGGAWFNWGKLFRSAVISADTPNISHEYNGFRTVQSGCRQQILKGGRLTP